MLAVLLVGVMAMSTLVGCGKASEEPEVSTEVETVANAENAEENNEETKDYTGKVLRIGWWGSDIRNEQTADIIDEFKSRYPGLEVEVEYAGYADYFTRLNTQAAGGEMPDVIQMDVGKYYMYANNNQLLDLSSYVENGSIDVSNVSDSEINATKVCGGLYGIATGMNGLAMMYNPAILEEAGCTLSEQPTLSEVVEVAKQVYEKTGARMHTIPNEVFYRSLGGNLYADGEDAFGFTEEMLLTWMETIYAATEGDYVRTPENVVDDNYATALSTGELWCVMESSNQIKSYVTNSGVELEMVTQFAADDATVENPTYLKPAMMWSVAANTEMSDLAVAFVDYFINDTYVYDVCGADRGVPISSAIREYLAPSLSAEDQKGFDYVDYLSSHSTPMNLYTPERASEALVVIDELREKIWYMAVDKEVLPELVHEAYEKASAILSGN